MKILVVDDSSTMRRIITNTLIRAGFSDIDEASNGKEGLDRFNAGGIELVLTDWNMPVMDGLEFVTELRKINLVPILMVTTNAAKEDIIVALQAGVNNYVVKPFTPETLKAKIDNILS